MQRIEGGDYEDYMDSSSDSDQAQAQENAPASTSEARLPSSLPAPNGVMGSSQLHDSGGIKPTPPECAPTSDKAKTPRKNWKSDYGNWIYILGRTGSSFKAKEVAKQNGIEKFSSVLSNSILKKR